MGNHVVLAFSAAGFQNRWWKRAVDRLIREIVHPDVGDVTNRFARTDDRHLHVRSRETNVRSARRLARSHPVTAILDLFGLLFQLIQLLDRTVNAFYCGISFVARSLKWFSELAQVMA